ncbi:MAG: hypothetical protein HND52_20950, partial [Ignavibacteriae bacterium]|nr:hypothetical protein [Ignavibacteriota bacterium]NOH00441.1 hypothetical protein [Ignavibacteriota bacterium]
MVSERSALRHQLEYWMARSCLGFIRILPGSVGFWITDRLGDLAYMFDRSHREVAKKNLSIVFGGDPDDPVHRRTTRMVFRNFLRVCAEFALLPRLVERHGLDAMIEIVGRENVEQALSSKRGVIVVSAHFGNWEVIAAAGEPLGLKLHSVGRVMDNPLLDAWLLRERGRWVRSVVPKEGGLPSIVRILRS